MNCELCSREIVKGCESKHHLTPKSNGGLQGSTAVLHSVCHKQIHALFTNKVLKNNYNTLEKLLDNVDVKNWIKWYTRKNRN